jgi:hypothetical protein
MIKPTKTVFIWEKKRTLKTDNKVIRKNYFHKILWNYDGNLVENFNDFSDPANKSLSRPWILIKQQ